MQRLGGAASGLFGSFPQFFKRYEDQNVGGGLLPIAVSQAQLH
ncbi:hypothetical protein C4K03_0230 [Pseudomonas synxantha]|uniref:Uncharacterized protein n=1 Tax=Pseudomonas synxantha TaxID=47883 RepID=A0A3G7U170_9PSED|nr:hypothetical protein C4K03_0230 [Pseudomonas synxantha]